MAPAQAGPAACRAGLSGHQVFPVFEGGNAARTAGDLRRQLGSDAGRKAWGLEENLTIARDAALGQTVMTVRLPKGSINPKNRNAPLGGMGWRWRWRPNIPPNIPVNLRRACLTYNIYLARGFTFRRGGKLPGLFGGDAPAGGKVTNGSSGFSTRLMWRSGGAGEVYAYIPGHPRGRGRSIGRGAWWFDRERWIAIAQEVVLNTPGKADGIVRIWIDGVLKLEQRGLVFTTAPDIGISGVMADIFYGGKSPSWAAPNDTFLRLSAFRLSWQATP